MNAKELKQQRVQLFRDAANFKKTERIPHFANVVTWKVFDAGLPYHYGEKTITYTACVLFDGTLCQRF